MSDTKKHKILGKFNNGIDVKIPISIKKHWNRINFDVGFLRKLKQNKVIKALDISSKDE